MLMYGLAHLTMSIRQPRSGAIIAIDGDILLSEVTSQHPVATTTKPQRNLQRNLGLLHHCRDRGLVIRGIALASVSDADAAEPDREPVAVGALAGFADCHHDAAPIRIFAGDGGLDQRRIGNR